MSRRKVVYRYGARCGSSSNDIETSSEIGCPSRLLTLISSLLAEPSFELRASTSVCMKTGYSSIPVVSGFRKCSPGPSGVRSTPPPARWMTMPTYPGFTYVSVFGSSTTSATTPATSPATRPALRASPGGTPRPSLSTRKRVNRSPSEVSLVPLVMENLLVAIGTDPLPVGKQNHVLFRARSVNATHQSGRALEPPPVASLSESNARRRKPHDHDVEEGGRCRDQRDEQHALGQN